MLDILISIIEELTGTKKAPPPPPRRHVRPPPPPPQSTGPAAQGNSPEFDKMVRQFFGIPEEEGEEDVEAELTAPPPPPARRPEPRPIQPAPAMSAEMAVRPNPEPMAVADRPVSFGKAATADMHAPPPRPAKSTHGRDLAAKLRGNPKAARDAFIYSEIFGPPLADR